MLALSPFRWRIARGFSLLDMLVVFATISLLAVILLPAIQQAREKAYRMRCQNNFMQLGVALRTYNQTHSFLPSGSVNETGPVRSLKPTEPMDAAGYRMGWIPQLLPYFEQSILWREINFEIPSCSFLTAEQLVSLEGQPSAPDDSMMSDQNQSSAGEWGLVDGSMQPDIVPLLPTVAQFSARVPHIPFLICPSSGGRNAVSHYVGCQNSVEKPIDVDGDGLLYLNSSESLSSIPDGASSTLLLGEILPADPYGTMSSQDGSWMVGDRSTLRNGGEMAVGKVAEMKRSNASRQSAAEAKPIEDQLENQDSPAQLEVGTFGSQHITHVGFLFADGSGQFLSHNVSVEVLTKLISRKDGSVVSGREF